MKHGVSINTINLFYSFKLILSITKYHNQAQIKIIFIGNSTSSYHIGFDPDYEILKNTRPVDNETPDDRIL